MNVVATAQKTEANPRSVTILGATGSVGCNTIDLIAQEPGRFVVEALTGNRNAALLAQQARQVRARFAVVADPQAYAELKAALAGTGIEAAAGRDALIEAAVRPAECVMASIVGAAGLEPTLAAVRRGAIIGLANKECLVCAGELVTTEIARCNGTLIPVDSEHSAIFQVFEADNAAKVERIILTASGGPFRTYSSERLATVTPEQAVAHPNWSMGAKISVDSATMMNKGLEMIEAFHLFPVRAEQIEVVVHPQSIIHGLVAYCDGSLLAQLGCPDMRTPIACALAWPTRMAAPSARLNLAEIATLTFEAPDATRFPGLRLAREALAAGGAAPAILNAANEVGVHSFLARRIGFLDIARVVEETLGRVANRSVSTLADVIAIDAEARAYASEATQHCQTVTNQVA
jgi:1-deoxy-D-xylulose-5-phosphate reductoisomerase